jgi:hypothetical protein
VIQELHGAGGAGYFPRYAEAVVRIALSEQDVALSLLERFWLVERVGEAPHAVRETVLRRMKGKASDLGAIDETVGNRAADEPRRP